MYFLICIDVIFEQLHQTHESDITDLIKYVATPNTGLKMFLSLISFRNGPSTKFWPVLLTRSPVLANTSSCFSVIYFLICADVIFVQLHQNTIVISLTSLNMWPRPKESMLKMYLSLISFRSGPSTRLPKMSCVYYKKHDGVVFGSI